MPVKVGNRRATGVVAATGPHWREGFEGTEFNERYGEFSPDGRYIACVSDETGEQEIYIRPYPGPGGQIPVSPGGGRSSVWGLNGQLFYRTGERMMAVSVTTEPTLIVGDHRELFESAGLYRAGAVVKQFDVTADGERFLMLEVANPLSTSDEPPTGAQINVVLNWFEELKERVPVP